MQIIAFGKSILDNINILTASSIFNYWTIKLKYTINNHHLYFTHKEEQVFGRVKQAHFGTVSDIQTGIYREIVKTFT